MLSLPRGQVIALMKLGGGIVKILDRRKAPKALTGT
jgi:hypothetical protein